MSKKPTQPSNQPRGLEFGIANFKAFGPNLQSIKLKPLTLVFGTNSAGKSSLFHSLLWAKDVLESGDPDVRRPTSGHGLVDLGGFENIRFQGCGAGDVQLKIALPWTSSKDTARIGLNVTLRYGTKSLPPNVWKAASEIVSKQIREIRDANPIASSAEVAASLILRFHVGWAWKQLPDGEFSLNPHRSERIAHRHCPTVMKIWDAHPDLARLLADSNHDNYLAALRTIDSRTLLPTLDQVGATLDTIQKEMSAFWILFSKEIKWEASQETASSRPHLREIELDRGGDLLIGARKADDGLFWLTFLNPSVLPANCPLRRFPKRMHLFFHLDVNGGQPVRLNFDSAAYKVFSDAFDIEAINDGQMLRHLGKLGGIWGQFGISWLRLNELLCSLEYIGPLRPIPGRHEATGVNERYDQSWQRLIADEQLRRSVNEWLSATKLGLRYAVCVDHMVDLGAVTKVVKEQVEHEFRRIKDNAIVDDNHVVFQNTTSLDPTGKETDPDIKAYEKGEIHWGDERLFGKVDMHCGLRNFEDNEDFLEMLDEKGVLDRMLAGLQNKFSTPGGALLRLRDLNSGAKVALQDVGVGISQVLPLVLKCASEKNSIIAIEQPEIHVHPAKQAELGDLFIDSAVKQGNTLLLETHSEHLILRIMRRMRETFEHKLPDGLPPITPDDVSILYVEPGEDGSVIREMPLNERGELVKGWPGGFFEEALNEM